MAWVIGAFADDLPSTQDAAALVTTTAAPTTTTTTVPTTTTTTTTTTTVAPASQPNPEPKPRPEPATQAPPPVAQQPAQNQGCHPGYTPCVPIADDVDCRPGSGNGPAYVTGPIKVIGPDEYDLDRNNDGVGCE